MTCTAAAARAVRRSCVGAIAAPGGASAAHSGATRSRLRSMARDSHFAIGPAFCGSLYLSRIE